MQHLAMPSRDEPLISSDGSERRGGEPIPERIRRKIESLLACDLTGVRLHVCPGLMQSYAVACAQGEDILLSPAAPSLESPAGIAVLGHELAHVLQQRAGRLILSADGRIFNEDELENEADRLGFHCAAQFFPDALDDPGMPEMDAPAVAGLTRRAAPVQFLISSRESFRAFVNMAWNYFRIPMVDELSGPHNLQDLYNSAAQFNPYNEPPKQALGGTTLYEAMADIVTAVRAHKAKVQIGNWPKLNPEEKKELIDYYEKKAGGQNPQPVLYSSVLPMGYLHVYPKHKTVGDWRFGLNVTPTSMAGAVQGLVPLLDNFADIDHMKFMGPLNVAKADSVIVYLRRGKEYEELKKAVLEVAAALSFQKRVGAIWEEIAPGVGEASEPPMEGASFTTYRCLIAYLAYVKFLKAKIGTEFADYKDYLDNVMGMFGLDPKRPYDQGPLPKGSPYFQTWWKGLETLGATWGVE